ncbi:MAG: tetratricopeptide repeat protein, partial [Chloroflexota bacterium]
MARLLAAVSTSLILLAACSMGGSRSTAGQAFQQGFTAQSAQDCQQAIRYYSAALAQDSHYVNAYMQRAQCYSAVGNYPAAIADYQQAAKQSDDGNMYVALGNAYLASGQTQLARTAFNEALKRLPRNPSNLAMLADRFAVAHDPTTATSLLQEAIKETPDNWKLWEQMGNVQAAAGLLEDALASFARALKAAPPSAFGQVYDSRAGAYLKAGLPDKAITDYQAAIKAEPRNVDRYMHLGSAYQQYQRWSEAATAYKQASALNPSYPPAYQALASLEQQRGDSAKALQYYQKALSLVPPTDNATRAGIQAAIQALPPGTAVPPAPTENALSAKPSESPATSAPASASSGPN